MSFETKMDSIITKLRVDIRKLKADVAAVSGVGKAADSELLDGLDSTAFLRTTGKAADSELLDGLDSTAFARAAVIARAVKRQNAHPSGGGQLTWTGSTLSGSQRYIWIPAAAGQGGHWNLENPSAWTIPNVGPWSLVYYRATDAEWESTARISIAPSAMSIVGYGSYVPHENDLVLGVHNGDAGDGQFYLSDGRVLAPGQSFFPDTGWITPTFESTFSDYGGVHACRYRRKNGIVYIKGLVNSSSTASGTVFTLPEGFRPPVTHGHLFIGMTQAGPKRFDVRPNGTGYAGQVVYDIPAASWNSVECSFPAGE